MSYYAGLDVGRYLWGFSNGVGDALTEDFAEWFPSTPAWAAYSGRIAWDIRCKDSGEGSQWGSRCLLLPEVSNMTVLVIKTVAHRHQRQRAVPDLLPPVAPPTCTAAALSVTASSPSAHAPGGAGSSNVARVASATTAMTLAT
ncbi:hypothetical protein E2562_017135 [Oryza meyeriana var. granulata]|uniref:Uncharacterized protein n=1 Tax=Oryza meyeriana var. granulata TaxID=110450 RepID=A0A6G1DXQ0_9ORYZ|nr:hypothetical protein E2562_017135 [Oryza meyeriana var. granulata]